MPYIGKQPTVGNFQVCDAISVVDGQAAYTMQVGGSNVEPENANHMLVSLNGILQKPGSYFTISGSTITFASNLATGDVIDFITLLGDTLNTGAPSDDTVTAAKLNDDIISGQTALTSSPDDTDELLISDAGTIKRIDVSLVGGKNTPNFEATKTDSNQSINNDTTTKVTFNNETFDSASAFASDKFTVPSGQGGKYFIYASVAWNNDDNGRRAVFLHKNGSEVKRLYETDAGSLDAAHVSAGALLNLSASDYIEVYCYQTTGSAENVLANNEMTYFGGYKIIE